MSIPDSMIQQLEAIAAKVSLLQYQTNNAFAIENLDQHQDFSEAQIYLHDIFVDSFVTVELNDYPQDQVMLTQYAECLYDEICDNPGYQVPSEYFDHDNIQLFIHLKGNWDAYTEQMWQNRQTLQAFETPDKDPSALETETASNASTDSETLSNASNSPTHAARRHINGPHVRALVNTIEDNVDKNIEQVRQTKRQLHNLKGTEEKDNLTAAPRIKIK